MDIATGQVKNGAFIAPGAPVFRSRYLRAGGLVRDLAVAVLIIWMIPFALGLVASLLSNAVSMLPR